jgi:hypothetical protein
MMSATNQSYKDSVKDSAEESVGGYIRHYGLEGWWLSTFTPEEREQMTELFQPFGNPNSRPLTDSDPLTVGGTDRWRDLPQELRSAEGSPSSLLTGLANTLNKPDCRHLARKVIAEAGRQAIASRNVLDLHFAYQAMIRIYYRDRKDAASLEVAVQACHKMIALGPLAIKAWQEEFPGLPAPGHQGFKQLRLLCLKQGNWEESERLERAAKAQGWNV